MKKIIQIGGNLRINGISSFIMTLYRKMHSDYQFIFINTAKGEDHYREEILSLGGKVYDVCVKGKGLIRSLRQSKQIREIIRKEKPIAVHSHYFSNNGLYLKQAYKENVPVRVSHCHQANPHGLTLGKRIAKAISARMVKKYATHCFACSDAAREFMYGAGGETIYNTIDYSRFYDIENKEFVKYGLDASKKYFLFVGRFAKQKNIAFLLNLCLNMRDRTDIGFVFVGHGPLQQEIESFILHNGLNNVKILPPDSNVAELMSLSYGLLLPSKYEGLSIVLIEAQAVGIKCLVSEAITQEAQLGLLEYLPLKEELWMDKIDTLSRHERSVQPCKCALFDDYYLVGVFDGVYSDIDSEEWIKRGKEYSIGSARFYRHKELSQICFFRAAELGDPRGAFYYALGYFEGNGVSKNINKAQAIVAEIKNEIECEAKNKKANFLVILGDMYSFGLGKERDFGMAFGYYSEAADLGNLEAMCDLGYMYLVGQGVEKNEERSFYWYKKSADLGYVHSMRDVGQNYLHGYGVKPDAQKAMEYFEMASKHNYSHGTGDIAYCFLNGVGVEKDLEKAKEYLLKALEQDAERTMRDLFSYGIDVESLTQRHELRFVHYDELKEIGENNSYAGTLCVTASVKFVDPACFYSSSIKKIFVENDNEFYCAEAGVLFSKDKKTLVRYPLASPEKVYTVPEGIETIGRHAFQNARNIEKVILPHTVVRIEDSAFDDCKNLFVIELPDSLGFIGAWAFHGCDSLKRMSIPANVTEIGAYAFGSCECLEWISVSCTNAAFVSQDGNLYTADKRILLQYAIGKKNEKFTAPDETEKIAFRALSDAYFLREIDLSNVKDVGEKAFAYDKALTRITYKSGVTFGEDAFAHTSASLIKEVVE